MKPKVVAIIPGLKISSRLPGSIFADIVLQVGLEYETVREYVEKFRAKGFVIPLPIPSEAQAE